MNQRNMLVVHIRRGGPRGTRAALSPRLLYQEALQNLATVKTLTYLTTRAALGVDFYHHRPGPKNKWEKIKWLSKEL